MEMDRRDLRQAHSRAHAEHIAAAHAADRIATVEKLMKLLPAAFLAVAYDRYVVARTRAEEASERTCDGTARCWLKIAHTATSTAVAASTHRYIANRHGDLAVLFAGSVRAQVLS